MTRETYSRSNRKVTSKQSRTKEDKSEKLIKSIKFELEVQRSLALSAAELHKKRLGDLKRCLV